MIAIMPLTSALCVVLICSFYILCLVQINDLRLVENLSIRVIVGTVCSTLLLVLGLTVIFS